MNRSDVRSLGLVTLVAASLVACGPTHGPAAAGTMAVRSERRAAPARPAVARPAPVATTPSPWATEPPASWTVAPIAPAARQGRPAARARPRPVELRVDGMASELSVSPSGALWLTTDTGHSYRADSFGAPWRPGSLDCTSAGAAARRAPCGRVTFFTADVAIATGYVGDGLDEYFRTEDAGRTWARARFAPRGAGRGQWIYDVFATASGEAWMGGSHGFLQHSSDFGRTWDERTAPFDHSSRLHRIFMADRLRGVVGALANALKVTRDGGRSWTSIETPLDQRATSGAVADPDGDDQIQNVALFGGSLLVQQGSQVFASPEAAIQWRPVASGTLVAFEVDREGQHAFGVTRDRAVVRLDATLAATPVAGARLATAPLDLRVDGAELHALDESVGLYRADASGVRFTPLLTSSGGPQEIASVRRAGEQLWGVSPHGLYASDDGGATWSLERTSDVRWLGLEAQGPDALLLWDETGAVQRYEVRARRLSPVRDLDHAHVSAVVVSGQRWVALGGTPQGGEAWMSTDGGGAWAPLDRWAGAPARDAFVLQSGAVVLWAWDGALRRAPASAPAAAEARVPSSGVELPCCTSLYFADERRGFLRGYVHHMGDHAWASDEAGVRWDEPADGDVFPYARVVAYRDGALAVVGRSFSFEETNRRELFLLRGLTRRLVYRAPEEISDVSVDSAGRILLELDPDPESYEDATGKHWLELLPG